MKLDLGCGATVRPGFIGVDGFVDGPNIHKVNLENEPLPFEDNSVDEIFSSHCFEHILHPFNILNEMLRVCSPGAKIEIWTPYGHSNDAFLCGHELFYTELHWRHYVTDFPDVWTPNRTKHYNHYATQFHLLGGVRQSMEQQGIPMRFAIRHMVNVAWEWCVRLEVLPGRTGQHGEPEVRYTDGR
jgi:predicted SAM-dependent methyltransferase